MRISTVLSLPFQKGFLGLAIMGKLSCPRTKKEEEAILINI
jgi:hypothetical protein